MITEFEQIAATEVIVKDCIEIIQARTIAEEHTEWENGYNAALKKIAFDLKVKFDV
jgi:hypothetical protein